MREKSKKSWRDRGFDFINNIGAGVALMIICGLASIFYSRFGEEWSRPIINGLVTGAVVLSLYLSIRAVLSLPSASPKTTPENVGVKVLSWLHKFNLTVKTEDAPDADFFYIVTTEGGKKIGVRRNLKLHPDSIYVTGLITLTEEEQNFIKGMSEVELFEVLFDTQQEIWRGYFGFDSRDYIASGLKLHLRIPITENTSETIVLNGIWRMEAIIGHILAINARAALRHNESKKEKSSGEQQVPGRPGRPQEIRRGNDHALPGQKDGGDEEEANRKT